MRTLIQWRWHLDEVFVRINGETYYLWRAVDHEGEVLEVFVTQRRDRMAALRLLDASLVDYGRRGVCNSCVIVHRSSQNVPGGLAEH